MHYSMGEVLKLTLFSMGVVFLVLVGLMFLMMINAKIFGKTVESTEGKEKRSDPPAPMTTQELVEGDPLAKVAVITALAVASEEKSGSKFQVAEVKRMK
ncbi:hypothetical protein NRIC_36000 [Enterococcus florum]|uniref:Oxaloacetate decarboxylase gamma chain n=1 Tax=Enterococcus florum TaxID=2480627 RepID=A0A4V0WQ08_9ENTE|nr:OadG family protein [Enterococcus florum]GCF95709.1 hypothetical protein NRIC_36000 [Enterococcus florum]